LAGSETKKKRKKKVAPKAPIKNEFYEEDQLQVRDDF
jgi:hypothetical protein